MDGGIEGQRAGIPRALPEWRAFLLALGQLVGVSLLAVLAAALLRKYALGVLGTRIVWVTFYPAVIVASLVAGFWVGLLTAALSCLLAAQGWFLIASAPFIQDQVDLIGLIAFFVNCVLIAGLSEHSRRSRARAEEAQGRAEAANRAKSAFLARMSHELRTPLNAILGFSSLLKEKAELPEQGRRLSLITRSGEHLLALINDMLDMARIESGKLGREITTFDLPALLQDATEMLREQAEGKGLEFEVELAPPLPRLVRSDERKLRQVLLNLLGNAIKFTATGKVALHAQAEFQKNSGTLLLRVTVQDTGPGIAPENQARIFEPFVQVEGHTSAAGTGLGLAIARQHMEIMGGRLNLESEPGQGSRFILELPMEFDPGEQSHGFQGTLGWSSRLAPGQDVFRILIVEDLEENWTLLKDFLELAGFQVAVAQDGAQGVAVFQAFHPHFIFMDERMPIMVGTEATRRIRALEGGTQTRIAALSASVFEEDRDRMLAAGMDDFLRKPFQPQDILSCLQRHLGAAFVSVPPSDDLDRPPEPPGQLDLSALPEALRAKFRDALLHLDSVRLNLLLAQVSEIDPTLAKALHTHISRYQYTSLLNMLGHDPGRTA